ncbi:uncharacterized protein LOC143286163 [Babylonia areolata]|uniref:uncharacterized protein LOC143286163 n=1 Tax=Babylonia areolata TaxID=304850 RepID=UPI003FD1ACBA
MPSVLENFGLSPELDLGVLQAVWGHEVSNPDLLSSPAASLGRWLPLLPAPISQQITMALNQERPFLPPDVTPEMMAESNKTVPSMNHIEIIYRCIDFAMKAVDYQMAAALVYVVDRACYRFGKSAALLSIVDTIRQASPDTAIAPQVILRQARVMKDRGDLHTSMRVLDAVITRERKWDYKTAEQYENTKAVCVQIKGQILHNLGLWKEAVPPLVESVHSFNVVQDNKGTSSSLALLSRCLKKLEVQDYQELQRNFLGMFVTDHPFYEAYQKGVEAVRLIADLGVTVYAAHNQMVADESLLMFTIQHRHMTHKQKLDQFQVIVAEMKRSLANHRTVRYLHSLEVYLAFVRAVFIISLTLHFSPVPQDAELSRFLEKLSLELYAYMCQQMDGKGGDSSVSTSLHQNQYSVRRMNGTLALLGLPTLEGSADVDQEEVEKKWSEVEKKTMKSRGVTSSESGDTPSIDSTDSSCQKEESPLASSSSQSDKRKESQNADSSPANVGKARTFPAVNPSKFQHGRRLLSTRPVNQKFVGLAMSKEDLLSATCPAFAASVNQSNDQDDVDSSQPPVDVDCLVVSADSIASATASAATDTSGSALHSSSDRASGSSSDVSGSAPLSGSTTAPGSSSSDLSKTTSTGSATVDQSASTQSTSSGTADSWEVVTSTSGLSSTSTSSATVDQSASTRSTSSGTADSWEVSTTSTSGLSSSGASGVMPPSTGNRSDQGSKSSGNSIKSSSDTVDQQADTEPSSTSDSAETEETDLSPLVDVSSSYEVMAGLDLGSSVETSDSEEFLANFVPFDNKDVHKAVLMIYNPLTGLWTAQTTLAYQGPVLNMDTKGTHRDAFHVSFLHQDEPLGRYVGKRYRKGRRAPEVYMQDVVCQMLAGYYVTRFNQALQNCTLDIFQVQFLSAAHLQLLDKEGKVFDWINVEPFLHGSFLKLTNNLYFVSKKPEDEQGVEVATALSHFSYSETNGALMMVDLQGWTPTDRKGVVFLTDPVFHTRNMKQFSSGDRHQEGMDAFWTNQHPRCNRICQYLGLDKSRPDGNRYV